ncbi:MAG: prepilin peptidase [Lachnospiraceae bacterium]|nr:prepilin peptidase [Lachnospiraceae bacterium]
MAALCVLLTAACGYDYRDRRVPNYLILLTAISGIGWRSWNGMSGVLFYLGQALLVMLLLYPFFKIGGLGAGDVKLLGVTAGYLPFEKVLAFLFCSLFVAAVISIIKMWRNHTFRDRMRYLTGYLTEVIAGRRWQLYRDVKGERHSAGICLSGPVLISILLYLGGVY